MIKWLNELSEWFLERNPLWAWEPGYETINHMTWLLIALFGTLGIGLFVPNVVLWLSILFGGGQLIAFLQEGVRTMIAKKLKKGMQSYYIKNVFGSIVGLAFGGLIAFVIWRVFL